MQKLWFLYLDCRNGRIVHTYSPPNAKLNSLNLKPMAVCYGFALPTGSLWNQSKWGFIDISRHLNNHILLKPIRPNQFYLNLGDSAYHCVNYSRLCPVFG